MNLNELSHEIHGIAKSKGFWDSERNVGELLMLVVTEVSEALEAHRAGRFAPFPIFDGIDFKNEVKDTFQDEIADTIIRLLDLCGGMGIDIETHVKAKMQYNQSRERLHGKNY